VEINIVKAQNTYGSICLYAIKNVVDVVIREQQYFMQM